jgi:hypothetical protein
MAEQVKDFLRLVRGGEAKIDVHDALASVAVIDAAYRSMKTGCWETVTQRLAGQQFLGSGVEPQPGDPGLDGEAEGAADEVGTHQEPANLEAGALAAIPSCIESTRGEVRSYTPPPRAAVHGPGPGLG